MPSHALLRPDFPSTMQLLVDGGDERIALNAPNAVNRYGCAPYPDPNLHAFGSSTASVISQRGFDAANQLRERLLHASPSPPHLIYAHEMQRVRQELLRLCGIQDEMGTDVIFAASGTDLHLITTQLIGSTSSKPTRIIMMDANETGKGVPTALAGRHFSRQSALGETLIEGAPIKGGAAIEVVSVPIRHDDGTPRNADDIDADVEKLVNTAVAIQQNVLLILVDVTKTGMLAPSVTCATHLLSRLPECVTVLVDACQCRMAPSTLRAYLDHDFIVAITGSKFLTGPSFSGALLVPSQAAAQLRQQILPPAISAYSCRADWPAHWVASEGLRQLTNLGLLLRWEAALAELRAFRAVPDVAIIRFLGTFSLAVQTHLESNPVFMPLQVPQLQRQPLIEEASWDQLPTIIPFVLYRPTSSGRTPLTRPQTLEIFRLLQQDQQSHVQLHLANEKITHSRYQLGQPVACGERDGLPVSALRLCASARMIVEASTDNVQGGSAVIDSALAALDKVSWLVHSTFA